jgi:hypothetical protein
MIKLFIIVGSTQVEEFVVVPHLETVTFAYLNIGEVYLPWIGKT